LTALASVVTLPKLLHAAMIRSSTTYNATSLIAAGAGYLAVLSPGIVLVNRLERARRPVGNVPRRDP
jgi:ABC-type amino acid transport system permease subunit